MRTIPRDIVDLVASSLPGRDNAHARSYLRQRVAVILAWESDRHFLYVPATEAERACAAEIESRLRALLAADTPDATTHNATDDKEMPR